MQPSLFFFFSSLFIYRYVFIYSVVYCVTRLHITRSVSLFLYLAYTLIISSLFFFLTGTVGFLSCFWFTTKATLSSLCFWLFSLILFGLLQIYGSVKVD